MEVVTLKFRKREWIKTLLVAVLGSILFFGTSSIMSSGYLGELSARMQKSRIEEDNSLGQNSESDRPKPGTIDEVIRGLSEKFITYCFAKSENNIDALLSQNTDYIKSPDGSSFIRYTDGHQHIEGYMATDKSLIDYKQRWCYVEGDTALAGLEITLEGSSKPVIWYLHYKRENGQWKLYMLENE